MEIAEAHTMDMQQSTHKNQQPTSPAATSCRIEASLLTSQFDVLHGCLFHRLHVFLSPELCTILRPFLTLRVAGHHVTLSSYWLDVDAISVWLCFWHWRLLLASCKLAELPEEAQTCLL